MTILDLAQVKCGYIAGVGKQCYNNYKTKLKFHLKLGSFYLLQVVSDSDLCQGRDNYGNNQNNSYLGYGAVC